MKDASLISKSLLAGAKSTEIFAGLGGGGAIKSHLNAPSGLTINANIEVHSVSNVGSLLTEESRKETTDHPELGAAAFAGARRCNISQGLGADGGERQRHLHAQDEGGGNEGCK